MFFSFFDRIPVRTLDNYMDVDIISSDSDLKQVRIISCLLTDPYN